MIDGNQHDFVKEKAKTVSKSSKVGRVVQVYEHLQEGDSSNFECDIYVDGELYEERVVPYNGGHSGQIAPPKVGDAVLVEYREGEGDKPFVTGIAYTNTDRAPLARAGMYRDEYTAWQPEKTNDAGDVIQEEVSGVAGGGNIKVTGYTEYDNNPSQIEKEQLSPERSWYQISKELPTPDPSDPQNAPMTIEMYDAPSENEAHVTISLNKVNGADSAGTWGLKFNLKTGEFQIVDSEGYGITSDGSGNFTWNYETIEYSQGTTDFL